MPGIFHWLLRGHRLVLKYLVMFFSEFLWISFLSYYYYYSCNVVTAALKQPYPGWIEGMNGPTGLMIGAARGVVRSMHCNPDFPADIVPVDIAINAIIAAAYERGRKPKNESVDFFNAVLTPGTLPSWGTVNESINRQMTNESISITLFRNCCGPRKRVLLSESIMFFIVVSGRFD